MLNNASDRFELEFAHIEIFEENFVRYAIRFRDDNKATLMSILTKNFSRFNTTANATHPEAKIDKQITLIAGMQENKLSNAASHNAKNAITQTA